MTLCQLVNDSFAIFAELGISVQRPFVPNHLSTLEVEFTPVTLEPTPSNRRAIAVRMLTAAMEAAGEIDQRDDQAYRLAVDLQTAITQAINVTF